MKRETVIISTTKWEALTYVRISKLVCLILDIDIYKNAAGGIRYPANYIDAIMDYLGLVDVILVNDDSETHELLDKNNITFVPVICIIGGGGIPSHPGTFGHAFIAPDDQWFVPTEKETYNTVVMIGSGYGLSDTDKRRLRVEYTPYPISDHRRTIRTYKGITDELIRNIREDNIK